MKCPKCQHDNREGRKFCAKCGTKMGWVCPKCGYENEADELFCGECGTKITDTPAPKLEDMQDSIYIPEPLRQKRDAAQLELQGENRLVTALFADISGFTPLSNQHSPENVVNIVNDQLLCPVNTREIRINEKIDKPHHDRPHKLF